MQKHPEGLNLPSLLTWLQMHTSKANFKGKLQRQTSKASDEIGQQGYSGKTARVFLMLKHPRQRNFATDEVEAGHYNGK